MFPRKGQIKKVIGFSPILNYTMWHDIFYFIILAGQDNTLLDDETVRLKATVLFNSLHYALSVEVNW
jgi:hypothetical protein